MIETVVHIREKGERIRHASAILVQLQVDGLATQWRELCIGNTAMQIILHCHSSLPFGGTTNTGICHCTSFKLTMAYFKTLSFRITQNTTACYLPAHVLELELEVKITSAAIPTAHVWSTATNAHAHSIHVPVLVVVVVVVN